MLRVVIGENVTCAPPVIRWKYTLLESPTERRVRPSGDIEAVEMKHENENTVKGNTYND